MEEYKRNVAVGITTLAGLGGLLILMLMFGRVPLPGTSQSGYRIKVAMPSAGGLHPESRVNLAGIGVGQVETIQFRDGAQHGVLITARIRQNVDIPQAVTAQAYNKPLGGSPSLELNVPSEASAKPYLSKSEPQVIQGSVGGMAQQIGQELKSALAGPKSRFNQVASSIEKLADQWTEVGQNVGTLVEPRQADNVDADSAQPNLATIVQRTDRRMRELGRTLESIEKIVSDKKLIRDLRQTIANARDASRKLSTRVDEVSTSINDNANALTKRYVALADDLSGAVVSMEKLANQARAGEGTVGKLVNDPTLYQNMNDAVQRVNQAVDEMKLLLQKWKKEGVPVQF
jgi:phospholipid/cholesterol/gamma-HCH transport system substrate-binding protein